MPRILRDVRDQVFGIIFKLVDLQNFMGEKDDSIGTSDNWNRVLDLVLGSKIGAVLVVDPDHG